jgi:putative NADH-flavin reductase
VRVAVFGGTGAIGRHLVDQAVDAGHDVTSLVRDAARLPTASPRLVVVQGDLDDEERVATCLAGAEAVLSAVGPTGNTARDADRMVAGVARILAAMEQHGVRRLVALSGAAVRVEGERKAVPDVVVSAVARLFARHVVDAKQREYDLIRRSDLDWVIVRPPRVVEGPLTGNYKAGAVRVGPRSKISRADLGHFMLRQLDDDTYLRQAPFVTY